MAHAARRSDCGRVARMVLTMAMPWGWTCRIVLTAAGAVGVVTVAGCESSDDGASSIPPDQVTALLAEISPAARALLAAGLCPDKHRLIPRRPPKLSVSGLTPPNESRKPETPCDPIDLLPTAAP